MTKVVMRKRGVSLVPAEEEASDMLQRMPDGKDVIVEVRQARNIRAHRLYWALMTLLADNIDWLQTKEQASTLVKIAVHEVDTIVDGSTGEVHYEPRSINFESMEQGRFSRFLDRALYIICQRWLVGVDAEELRQKVFEIVDGPESASLGKRVASARAA